MENTYYEPEEVRIIPMELIKRLLLQWKAVFFVALIMAVLVSGAMYVKDMRAYRAASAAESGGEVLTPAQIEEKIQEIYDGLSAEDRNAVRRVIRIDDTLDDMLAYMEESPVQQMDPLRVRTLDVSFRITGVNDLSKLVALYRGYAAVATNEKALQAIQKAMDPSMDPAYVKELLSIQDYRGLQINEASARVVQVRIYLPEKAEAENVKAALTQVFRNRCKALSDSIAPHSIKLSTADVATNAGTEILYNRRDAAQSLGNLANTRRTCADGLKDEQKAAYEEISQLRETLDTLSRKTEASASGKEDASAAQAQDEQATVQKPGIRWKFAAAGFLLGIVLYACIYLCVLLFRKNLNFSSAVRSYMRMRLLGEYYYQTERKGWRALLSDRFLARCLYGRRMDRREQVQRIAGSLQASCRRRGIQALSLLLLEESAEGKSLVQSIAETAADIDLDMEVISCCDADPATSLEKVEEAVLLVSGDSSLAVIDQTLEAMAGYRIGSMGVIYVEGL